MSHFSELSNLKGEVVETPELGSQPGKSADHLWTPFAAGS